jgi:carbamoyltransferase
MHILGINAYHGDSSAALVSDGKLVAAAEEERFRRIKHWAGLPTDAVRYCLESAGITLDDLDILAVNQDSRAHLWKKIGFTLARRPDLKLVLDRIRNKRERESVETQLEDAFKGQKFRGKSVAVEHHHAHLSSAFHVSPFDEAVAVSVDGFGDFASGAWGVCRGTHIDVQGRVYFPHSLGIFYQALTQYLGFPNYGDEYKVMGLAPYGRPDKMEEMRRIVTLHEDGGYRLNLEYFRHHREKIEYEWENGSPTVGDLYSDALESLLGPARKRDQQLTQEHFDIARSVQAMYEEAFFHLLNTLYRQHGIDHLALSGGCAMNSVANGKVYRNTPYKKVYIQSAAGDAGGAIGAAFTAWHGTGAGRRRSFYMDHSYWGPQFSNGQIQEVLGRYDTRLQDAQCTVESFDGREGLFDRVAAEIAEGKVIGWFQGRMEWGPRALGNRSIVCDPRRSDMKDILNLKIKRRESFRPFAPSVLRESVADWFEENDEVPFMMKVFQIREEKRSAIPAVTHVDGSGRLQTVNENTNTRYYQLIRSFEKITGVPIVLNTSFNENEPVVCKPEEALDCFLRTRMDVLVLEDFLVRRNGQAA